MFKRKSEIQKLMKEIITTPGAFKLFIWCADYDPDRFNVSLVWRKGHDEHKPPLKSSGDSPENALCNLKRQLEQMS